jgi:dTDP-4-amino-4,6-dideoxy-D-galactose acyltransferase
MTQKMHEFLAIALPDPWLAGILERNVFRVILKRVEELPLHETALDGVNLEACLRGNPVFAYAKVATTALWAVRHLEEIGFRLVETNIVFEKKLEEEKARPSEERSVRFAEKDDRHAVMEIAHKSFIYSRFHLDDFISKAAANRIKEQWAGNYFSGERGDHMVVAMDGARVAGFLLLKDLGKSLLIDLIAVSPEQRRKGFARRMIGFAERSLKGFECLRVGTQVANMPSASLYENLGFQLTESSYVLHLHK